MTGLPAQPLEFSDFSGGITENVLQGDPKRYQYADNWLITVDKKITVRPALTYIDSVNYVLPVPNQRINASFTCINESILMMQSARTVYTIDPVAGTWVSILGPSGNETIGGGDLYSQNTFAEFQRQVYMTNDGTGASFGTQPTRIYRNSSNVWVSNTAGLPRAYAVANYTDSTLLVTCIAIANLLRTSMISHFGDAKNTSYTSVAPSFQGPDLLNLHFNTDKFSLNYFTAQTFNASVDPEVPTGVTPASVATDTNSLYTLVTALNNAYTHHMLDSLKDSTFAGTAVGSGPYPYYHYDRSTFISNYNLLTPRGPGVKLANNATPTTVAQAAAMLDDLTQKWSWHRSAIFTHSMNNEPAQMGKYGAGLTKILPIKQGNTYATITGDFTDVYNYVNNLKYLFNAHVTNLDPTGFSSVFHKQPDNYYNDGTYATQIRLPDCFDFDSMCLLIYWLRVMWYLHALDSQQSTHRNISFNSTAGSTSLTSVNLLGGSAVTIPVGSWIVCYPFNVGTQAAGTAFNKMINASTTSVVGNFDFVARVTASASGTVTIDRAAVSSITGAPGQYSTAWYHMNSQNTTNSSFLDTTTNTGETSDSLSTSVLSVGGSSDYASWLTLATEMFNCFASHSYYSQAHFQPLYAPASVMPLFYTFVPKPPFFIPSVASFTYAFFFSHSYTVEPNGIQYLVNGNPVLSASTPAGISYPLGTSIAAQNSLYNTVITTSQRANTISNLPVLANASNTNYDTSNIKLNIYRSTNGGTTYYLLAQVANGTTSYTDIVNDTLANPGSTALSNNQTMYTTGNVVGSDQPPQCKFAHILNGTVYYAGIFDTGQYFPQRLRQSLQFAPDWAPATFFDDMDDEITGLSSTRSNLIVFCKNSIYRESGGFNSQGQGALTHDKISDTLGCRNAKSIIRTEIGVFFAGNDGFYYTDGFQVINITLELKKTYASLTQTDAQVRSIYGAYDKITRRIWWSMKTSPTDTDNSIFYIFYLDYGVKPSGTFTTASNVNMPLRASSAVFQQGVMFLGLEGGFVLKSNPSSKADIVPVLGVAATSWVTTAIPYNFTSSAVDLGTTFKRKWLTKVHLTGNNTGNSALQMNMIRDLNSDLQGIKPLAPVNYIDNIIWGTPICIWGDKTQVWNNLGRMDLWRRFPQTSLRSDFMQLQMVPAKIAVYASSVGYPTGANCTINATTKTATILTPSGYTSIVWPNDVINYVIAFQTDGYVKEYAITALDGTKTIITYTDVSNTSFSGTSSWVIRGVKKEQRPSITSFVLHYAFLGDKVQKYPGKASTSGPGNAGENPS